MFYRGLRDVHKRLAHTTTKTNAGGLVESWANAQREMLDSPIAADLSNLNDDALLDIVQRQTTRYFWDGGHPVSRLARDRQTTTGDPANDLVAVGGSGFGIMAIIVAVNRGWIDSTAALGRLHEMLDFLERVPRYHGMFPHFINGRTGHTIPFRRKDDGGSVDPSPDLHNQPAATAGSVVHRDSTSSG
jgi:hypothetical protein